MTWKLFKLLMGIVLPLSVTAMARADGAVYAMTNALGNNQVLVFHRGADGSLSATPVSDNQHRRRRQWPAARWSGLAGLFWKYPIR